MSPFVTVQFIFTVLPDSLRYRREFNSRLKIIIEQIIICVHVLLQLYFFVPVSKHKLSFLNFSLFAFGLTVG